MLRSAAKNYFPVSKKLTPSEFAEKSNIGRVFKVSKNLSINQFCPIYARQDNQIAMFRPGYIVFNFMLGAGNNEYHAHPLKINQIVRLATRDSDLFFTSISDSPNRTSKKIQVTKQVDGTMEVVAFYSRATNNDLNHKWNKVAQIHVENHVWTTLKILLRDAIPRINGWRIDEPILFKENFLTNEGEPVFKEVESLEKEPEKKVADQK
ncbi:hypothetical protein MHBO_004474 [Bonamia ostreae]|uniref:Uncharacterized protein n=1 Tax=Bonamia ostreae TaxID=126728 RepID=A0ABV2AU64_9EUKA